MRRKLKILNMIVFMYLAFIVNAYAIPNLISYQGVLNDKDGVPISSAINITFKIYDVETEGSPLWSETQSVMVSNGLFNVKLGSVQPLAPSVFLSDTLYLGIQVASDPEMAPRQRITPGAYIHAIVPIGTIMAWAKSIPGIPALSAGWVECNGQTLIDPDSPLNGQIIPDLNGANRFLRGSLTSGGIGGEEKHTLTISEMPAHSHSYSRVLKHANLGESVNDYGTDVTTSDTGITGGSQSHENRPPFFNVVWIMRVK